MGPEGKPEPRLREPVLLYDGECGLCSRLVQWVLRLEREKTLRFASLQGAFASEVRRRYPETGRADTVIWLEPLDGSGSERVLLKSEAVLRLASYLGGPWRALGRVTRLVPRRVRDWLYDQVARRRRRWFEPVLACPVPPPEQRTRLLP
jgi:predicted DCC family thiol-disulfide oxidoreductase YuxK